MILKVSHYRQRCSIIFCVVCSENWFYNSILDVGGEEYFDAHRNNPLKYTLALLCCHRYGDAVSHLWQATKTLPAAHIAAVCAHYGLLLPHMPLTQNPPFPHAYFSTQRAASGDHLLTPSSMLQLYLNVQAQRMFPELCADFFMSLDVDWYQHCHADLEKSVLETNIVKSCNTFSTLFESFLMALDPPTLTRLTGEPPLEGKPSVGYLDQVLDRDTIHLILARCAFEVLHVKRDPETAIYFYKLSGRFLDALDELSTQLAGVVTTQEGAGRAHWLNVSTEFFDAYVRSGTGPLAEAVQRDGRGDLVNTFLQLLNVSSFVTSYIEGNYPEALHVLNELGLLPSSEADVRKAAQVIVQLPPSAKILSVLDDVLLLSMECALHVIGMLRRDAQSVMLTVVQQNDRRQEVERLRSQAQALVLFSTAVSTRLARPDTPRLLTTMVTNSGL